MAPAYKSAGAFAGSAGTTSMSTAFPASVAANDVAIIIATGYGAITLPGSFTSEAQASDGPSATNFRLGWKRCTGAEGGTNVTVAQSPSNQLWAQIFTFSDVIANGTPYEGYSANTGNSTVNLSAPAIVSTVADTLGVLIGIDNGSVTFTPASGYTERIDATNTAGIDNSHTVNTIIKASAGTTSAGTITASANTASGYAVFGFALKPVANAAIVPVRRRTRFFKRSF